MTKYKFTDLSPEAKLNAMLDYISGWQQTHNDDPFDLTDAESACLDLNDELFYNEKGELLDEY
ncbi:MAG TPA: hypothetical protein VI911_00615 [Patescibacteria group bacterium]|nr:hypothetical protein [Patescibacteria group bacterium]